MTEPRIPLVPPEVSLKEFGYIPLEFRRLFQSDTWVLGTPEEKVAAMHLWCESWHQVPAASLPNDDRMLAHLSGTGQRWKKLRAHALRGWLLCTDGRLYHPIVAEKALNAWAAKMENWGKARTARVAKLQKRIEAATGAEKQLLQEQLQAELQATFPPVTGLKRSEGKGREGKGPREEPLPDAARRASEGVTVPVWNAYAMAYQQRYRVEPVRNAKVNGQLAQLVQRLGVEEAPLVAAFYVGHPGALYVRAKHPVDLLLRDAEGLRTEWATGRHVTDGSARQSDKTATRGTAAAELLEEVRAAKS